MFSVSIYRPTTLNDLRFGELFEPLSEDRDVRYLAGRINGTEVRVALNGEHPFFVSERGRQVQQSGYAIEKLQFEVDSLTGSNRRDEADTPVGHLVRYDGGLAVCCRDQHDLHFAELSGAIPQQEGMIRFVSFGGWQIVVESGGERHVLFKSPVARGFV